MLGGSTICSEEEDGSPVGREGVKHVLDVKYSLDVKEGRSCVEVFMSPRKVEGIGTVGVCTLAWHYLSLLK